MLWNWEHDDWPSFTWDPRVLAGLEDRFLINSGTSIGMARHLEAESQSGLLVEVMTSEAVTSSAIEGEILDRSSVQRSIQRQLGLDSDDQSVPAAEAGMAEMMVDLFRSYAEPLSEDQLLKWNLFVLRGERESKEAGRYRTSVEPMQVVSGSFHSPKVHFQAPPSEIVGVEMSRFTEWFNRTMPGATEPLPSLTRAGIAHLYFESIHPFEDGNGRIGRAISEKALAQGVGQPVLTLLATAIQVKRKDYYRALESASSTLEITDWLLWFAEAAIEAQSRTGALIEFLIAKSSLFLRLHGQLNDRQERVLARMFREGPEGFRGGLSAANYASIANAAPATVTRDLNDLVAKGALVRTGELRHARYHLDLQSIDSPKT